MVDNGDVDNGCVKPLYEIDYLVLSFREGCLTGGGPNFGPPAANPGNPGSVSTGGGTTVGGNTGTGSTGTVTTGSGSTGTGNTGNGPADPNDPSLTENPINTAPVFDDRSMFERKLTDDELDWWRDPDNADDRQEIQDYMDEPDYDIKTAKAIIDNEIDGGDTDFDNKIIIDPTFKNNQKADCILTKMRTINAFNKALEPFEGENPAAFIKLATGNLDEDVRAETSHRMRQILLKSR